MISYTLYWASVKCARCLAKITQWGPTVQCIPLFSWHQNWLWAVTRLMLSYVPGALNLHIKLADCKGDYSVPSSAQVKNEWHYTSTPPIYVSKACTGTTSLFWTLILCHLEITNNEIYNCPSPINACTSEMLKGRSIVARQVTKLRAGESAVWVSARSRDFSPIIRPALKLTQPPVWSVSEVISSGWGPGEWLQHDIDHTMSSPEVKNKWSYTSTPPTWPSFLGQGQLYSYCLFCCQLFKKPDL